MALKSRELDLDFQLAPQEVQHMSSSALEIAVKLLEPSTFAMQLIAAPYVVTPTLPQDQERLLGNLDISPRSSSTTLST